MKTAVIYYSMSGNTAQTAQKIAAVLGADLIPVEPVKAYPSKGMRKFIWGGKSAVMGDRPRLNPYRFDGGYDRVILGTPVWASSFAPPIRSFIHENRAALAGKSIAAFACFSGGGDEKAFEKLRRFLGIDAFAARMTLTDPKDKPKPEDDEKIRQFCEQLKA